VANKPKQLVILKPGERGQLECLVAGAGDAATRAQNVLASAAGETDAAIAARLAVTVHEVAKWRKAYMRGRVAGIAAGPSTQRPPRRESNAQLLAAWRRAVAAIATEPSLAHLADRVREASGALEPFARDVEEFGRDASFPEVADRLLLAYETAQRSPSSPQPASVPAPVPAPRPSPEIPAHLIRRVAPDPRLSEEEAPAQFGDLAQDRDD
jgi:hypothetical protein